VSHESSGKPTKRCHIVPVFYLRGFCNAKDKLWVLDRKDRKIFQSSPKNVAVVRDFYTGESAIHEDNLEKKLSSIESDAAPQLRSLLRGEKDIGPEFIRLIGWMMARTGWISRLVDPYGFKGYLLRNFDELCQADTKGRALPIAFRGPADEITVQPLNLARTYLEDPAWSVVMSQDMLLDAIRMQAWCFQTMHLPRFKWVTLSPPAGQRFITSDRPVTWDVNDNGFHDFPATLKASEVDLIFPLSPEKALMGGYSETSMLQITITATELNDRVARRTDRFLFANDRSDLERFTSGVLG
jgi:hypothetical protein